MIKGKDLNIQYAHRAKSEASRTFGELVQRSKQLEAASLYSLNWWNQLKRPSRQYPTLYSVIEVLRL